MQLHACMQVINNNINTLSQGILLGSNFALDLPYAYGDNINNTITNNQITGCQISPMTLESALTVNMANNVLTDVLCNVFGELHSTIRLLRPRQSWCMRIVTTLCTQPLKLSLMGLAMTECDCLKLSARMIQAAPYVRCSQC